MCSQGASCFLACDVAESAQAAAEGLLVMVKSYHQNEARRILEVGRA